MTPTIKKAPTCSALMQAVKDDDIGGILALRRTDEADIETRKKCIEAKNNLGMTALMIAAKKGQTEIVKELLTEDRGVKADINARDNDNRTALICAASGEFPEAQVSESPRTEPIKWKRSYNPETVKVLLDAGADIEARDNDDRTAFYYWRDRNEKDHGDDPKYQEIARRLSSSGR